MASARRIGARRTEGASVAKRDARVRPGQTETARMGAAEVVVLEVEVGPGLAVASEARRA